LHPPSHLRLLQLRELGLGLPPQQQSQPPFCQRKNVQCALAPHCYGKGLYGCCVPAREVEYQLFSPQNGTLTPLLPSQKQQVKIQEWEANATNPYVHSCSWQDQTTICQSPNSVDPPGQYTDDMGAGSSSPYTVQQQFLVDRLGLQVFWPNSTPTLSKFDRMIGTASTTIAPSWL
jgi:hypothetical protein